MQRALEEAARGLGRTRPNPMVGCVVARGDEVLGVGHHARAGSAHAEVVALRRVRDKARGADLYVTLEPCAHQGRTAPCTEAIIKAGIQRVFIGARDPNPIVNGKGLRELRKAGIHVHLGLAADACRRLNEAYAHFISNRTPFVVAKFAQSLDGKVATKSGESQWITCTHSRKAGHRLRNSVDAVIVGVGTVLADDPQLTCRSRGGRDPIRIVVDTQARTPTSARCVALARTGKAQTWVVVGPNAPPRRCAALQKAGVEVLRCRQSAGRVDLCHLMAELGDRELLSVLVEGGPALMGSFVGRSLVNKVHAFVAPMIVGGSQAKGTVGDPGVATLAEALRLQDVTVERSGHDLLVVGYPMPKRKRPNVRGKK